jgi:hypothetical protein
VAPALTRREHGDGAAGRHLPVRAGGHLGAAALPGRFLGSRAGAPVARGPGGGVALGGDGALQHQPCAAPGGGGSDGDADPRA